MIPITLTDPHESVIPHSYVCRIITQHCSHCNRQHTTTETYTKTRLRKINDASKYTTFLRFLNEPPQYNLPIEKLEEQREVPFCHFCYNTVNLNHLTTPPDAEYVLIGSTLDDGIRTAPKARAKGSKEPARKPQPKVATIEDLERML